MAWHDTPPWRARQAEREETMAEVAKVVQKWNVARISAVTAVEKIRELLEPVRVRVGGDTHTPEVQS
jgi:hypothetical protein